jgi:hypothetical protein
MSEETNAQDRQATPEEIQKQREIMLQFYEEEIPLLEKRKHYDNLLADIEEARLRRLVAIVRGANLTNPPPAEVEPEEEEQPVEQAPKSRKLKTQ